jgi:hypothetical protein
MKIHKIQCKSHELHLELHLESHLPPLGSTKVATTGYNSLSLHPTPEIKSHHPSTKQHPSPANPHVSNPSNPKSSPQQQTFNNYETKYF